ncbi:hypothetical protein OQA88_7962 [Cercophora sp. LCS_1]
MAPTKFDPAKDMPDLTGKIILITGGTAGIGAATLTALASHNPAHLLFTGRNTTAAATVISTITKIAPSTTTTFLPCDLSSLSAIHSTTASLLSTLSHLDILLCNAGVMALPPSLSPDGYEIQFATNHLGHALLIRRLLPSLLKSPAPRVILVSSESFRGAPAEGICFDTLKTPQDMPLGRWRRYGQSKLANLLYARELSRRVPGVLSFSITPGVVNTGMVKGASLWEKAVVYLTAKVQSVEEGTGNLLWAVGCKAEDVEGGAFYEPVGVRSHKETKASRDEEVVRRLWEWTEGELERWM